MYYFYFMEAHPEKVEQLKDADALRKAQRLADAGKAKAEDVYVQGKGKLGELKVSVFLIVYRHVLI